MRRISPISALAIAVAAILPASLVADHHLPTDFNVSPSEIAQLNIRPKANFLGPDWWNDLAPAIYAIQVPDTNLCLQLTNGNTAGEITHITLRECLFSNLGNEVNFNIDTQMIEVSPAAVDVPPAALMSNVRWRFTNVARCTTRARGVLVGTPRVDWHPCELMPYAGGDVAFIGAPDQSFFLSRRGDRGTFGVPRYQIRVERKCWTIEGGNPRVGATVLMEECDGRAGQTFQFRYLGPLADTANTAAAEWFGWVQAPDVPRRNTTADRFRDLPGININNAGYSTTATASDLGQACAGMCRSDDNCSAFTWIPAPSRGSPAMCRLTQSVTFNDLVDSPGTNSGIMRP